MGSEFNVIARYFSRPVPAQFLGAGDDCALLPVCSGLQLAVSTDLLIEGRHFFADVDPRALGHKALAVNLSDLAAMGAQPLACVLGVSLPRIDDDWLAAFSDGFYQLADQHCCPLVGGDTTSSPSGVIVSVTVFGQVDPQHAMRRSGAKIDDDIWVSGVLGGPDIALRLLQGTLPPNAALLAATRATLERPDPPVAFAHKLAQVAHAALDISDGLVQDLSHITKASQCGAELYYERLPVDPAIAHENFQVQQSAVLSGGDVYQLCFTASPQQRNAILDVARNANVMVTRIGRITEGSGVQVIMSTGEIITPALGGFDHFKV